jgi:regulatory protein YycH of two-component signal transduction system YycFG
MINHLSYDRKIIKANSHSPQSNRYYLTFSTYELKTVSTHHIEEKNFEKNMKGMTSQMRANTPVYQNSSTTNSYAPYSPATAQTGIDLFELIRFIKTKKYNKRMKEQGQ